jgi:hypothetical protein
VLQSGWRKVDLKFFDLTWATKIKRGVIADVIPVKKGFADSKTSR